MELLHGNCLLMHSNWQTTTADAVGTAKFSYNFTVSMSVEAILKQTWTRYSENQWKVTIYRNVIMLSHNVTATLLRLLLLLGGMRHNYIWTTNWPLGF